MFRSLYIQQVWAGNENARSAQEAWELQDQRLIGRKVPFLCANEAHLQYGLICSLGWQVDRLLSRVDRQSIHFVFLEDLVSDHVTELDKIAHFLGLSTTDAIPFQKANESGIPRSRTLRLATKAINHGFRLAGAPVLGNRLVDPLNRWNKAATQRASLDATFRQRLVEYFSADIDILEATTGRSLTCWKG
jgi:hypothetical protein